MTKWLRYTFDCHSNQWETHPVTLRLNREPFGEGGMRCLENSLDIMLGKRLPCFSSLVPFFIVFPYFLNLKNISPFLRVQISDFRLSWSGEDWSTVRARSWRTVRKSMQLPGRSRRTPVDAHIGHIEKRRRRDVLSTKQNTRKTHEDLFVLTPLTHHTQSYNYVHVYNKYTLKECERHQLMWASFRWAQ